MSLMGHKKAKHRDLDPRESAVEKHLRERVEALGGMATKLKDPKRNGAPDRLVLLPAGFAMFVELKKKDEEPRDNQLRYHRDLRKLGYRVEVIDSKQQVDELLENLRAYVKGVADAEAVLHSMLKPVSILGTAGYKAEQEAKNRRAAATAQALSKMPTPKAP